MLGMRAINDDTAPLQIKTLLVEQSVEQAGKANHREM
jgi:hypothetical protein